MRNEHLLGNESARDVGGVLADGRPRAAGHREDGARDVSAGTEPSFLYIGTSKAGSTWLYAVLSQHPEIFVAPGKGLYFFSDHYGRGRAWYRQHFRGADGKGAIGEISHNYLYSPEAPERIAAMNPDMKLIVCVREPVERAFSDYLHRVKNGELDVPFEEAMEEVPSLVEHGRYAGYLRRYMERFGRDRIHVAVFDELCSDPDLFAGRIFDFLGVQRCPLPPQLRRKIMPAGEPRVYAAAQGARKVAALAKRLGLRGVVGRVKRSPVIRSILYREYTRDERPAMRPDTRAALRRTFAPDIQRLDQLLDTELRRLWGY